MRDSLDLPPVTKADWAPSFRNFVPERAFKRQKLHRDSAKLREIDFCFRAILMASQNEASIAQGLLTARDRCRAVERERTRGFGMIAGFWIEVCIASGQNRAKLPNPPDHGDRANPRHAA